MAWAVVSCDNGQLGQSREEVCESGRVGDVLFNIDKMLVVSPSWVG
jgi:hypothetical protein